MSMPFDVIYPTVKTCDAGLTAAESLKRQIAEHFTDRLAPPLLFSPDPQDPSPCGMVRSILKGWAGEDGTITVEATGATLTLRISDEGDRGISLHTERPRSIRPPSIDTPCDTSFAP
jgi:hypothetical protein